MHMCTCTKGHSVAVVETRTSKERPGQLDVYLEGNTSWKEIEEFIQQKKELGTEFRLSISKGSAYKMHNNGLMHYTTFTAC